MTIIGKSNHIFEYCQIYRGYLSVILIHIFINLCYNANKIALKYERILFVSKGRVLPRQMIHGFSRAMFKRRADRSFHVVLPS